MRTARDVMDPNPLTVPPDLPVRELAKLLHDRGADGACVVDANGRLEGVVTSMDLVFKQKAVHLPTFFWLLDMWIPIENPLRLNQEVDKIAAGTAEGLMTTDVERVAPDTSVDLVAKKMVERHLSIVPVVEGDRLVGVVTKPGMLREAFGI